MQNAEQIQTVVEGAETFHTFVPFVPRGEYVGALYMKNTPDFAFITRDLLSSYGQTTATYLALMAPSSLSPIFAASRSSMPSFRSLSPIWTIWSF